MTRAQRAILIASMTLAVLAAIPLVAALLLRGCDAARQKADQEIAAARARRADSLRVAQEVAQRSRVDSLLGTPSPQHLAALSDDDLQRALTAVASDSSRHYLAQALSHEKERRLSEEQETRQREDDRRRATDRRRRLQSILAQAGELRTFDGKRAERPTTDRVDMLLRDHPEWPDQTITAVACRFVQIGMTADQLTASWGRATDVNRTIGSWGVHEQWVYRESNTYVYLEDGKVTSWQD